MVNWFKMSNMPFMNSYLIFYAWNVLQRMDSLFCWRYGSLRWILGARYQSSSGRDFFSNLGCSHGGYLMFKGQLKTSMIDVYGCSCIPGRDPYCLVRNVQSHNKIFPLQSEGKRDCLAVLAARRRTCRLDLPCHWGTTSESSAWCWLNLGSAIDPQIKSRLARTTHF